MDIGELKEEIMRLKALLLEKEEQLYRAEQSVLATENASIASTIRGTTHSLICPFCGITLRSPPSVGTEHKGCYVTGYWANGFRTHNDWVRASIENGRSIDEFYKKQSKG